MKIDLKPMSEGTFSAYSNNSLEEYARDRIITDYQTLEEAKLHAQNSFKQNLPQGLTTRDHYFYDLRDSSTGETVGHAWLKVDSSARLAWLYDILIFTNQRRKGYGRSAMRALFTQAKDLGARVFWLNVMGHNEAAQKLYQHLNMQTAAIHLNMLLE